MKLLFESHSGITVAKVLLNWMCWTAFWAGVSCWDGWWMSLIHVLYFTLRLRCSFESDPETRADLICSLVQILHATFVPDRRCLCPTRCLGGLIIDWAESQESQPAEQQRLVLVRQDSLLPFKPPVHGQQLLPRCLAAHTPCRPWGRSLLPPCSLPHSLYAFVSKWNG